MLPEVIDLFSGCGGLALGFEKAGFRITYGVELSESAIRNISYNLDWRYGRESSHICAEITTLDPCNLLERVGNDGCIVIGGPPCQAYSLAGRAKLRSLGEDRAHTNDARGYLYQDFLRFVYGLNAKAVVMENVPESIDYNGTNIPQIVCEDLQRNGYSAQWTILNAANYGVPQVRERVIVVAKRNDMPGEIVYPIPSHKAPESVTTTIETRMKSLVESPNFCIPPMPSNDLPEWVTVGDAITDLPALFPSYSSKYASRKLNVELPYSSEPQNSFQRAMREWYGYPTAGVTANFFRNNARDFPIFEMMAQGADYIDASQVADSLLTKQVSISSICEDDQETIGKLRRAIVPCYDRSKFEAKWKRLSLDKPSHTIVAHLAKDTYSHIHPTEPRGISVREAARLQSFPDDYFFVGSNGDAYKQIGNAVPVLLSFAIACSLKEALQ